MLSGVVGRLLGVWRLCVEAGLLGFWTEVMGVLDVLWEIRV